MKLKVRRRVQCIALFLGMVFTFLAIVEPMIKVEAAADAETETEEAASTETWPASISIESPSAIVMEVNTGTVLYEYNADESLYPASITKIMTALLAIENCDLDEIVTFSETAVYENEGDTSHIAREVGEEMTLENCLYGMMLESANECAWAIGEHVGGTMENFVAMMNAKAEELGCTGTHFNNPNGLPDEDHYVTARDMALIAQAAISYPKFREIISTLSYTIPADNKKEEYTLRQSHRMISKSRGSEYIYEYAIGGKTGYTVAAGSTLVTFAEKDGMLLVCVILNTKSPSQYTDTISLFDYCFENFSMYQVSDYLSIDDLEDEDAAGVLSDKIDLIRVDDEGLIILPNTASFSDATPTVKTVDDDSGAVATVEYSYAGRVVGSANLLYETIGGSSFPFLTTTGAQTEEETEATGFMIVNFGKIIKNIFLIIIVVLAALILVLRIIKFSQQARINANRKKNRRTFTLFTADEGDMGKPVKGARNTPKRRRRKNNKNVIGVKINRTKRRKRRRRW